MYNGFNHFCATKHPRLIFKDGVKELVSLLSNARVLCDKLGKGSKDPIVKQVFSKTSENSQTAMYSVDKLMQTAHEAPQEEAEASSTKRKRRDSGDKKIERHARDGTTKWTDTTCKCGVEKHIKEELKAHIQRRHDDGKYMCPYKGCGMETKFTSRSMSRTSIWMNTTTGVCTVVITKLIKSISLPTTCVTNMAMD